VYTGGGVDTDWGLSWTVGSFESPILSPAISNFLFRSSIVLLCSSFRLETSLAKC
ncbi:hypothetical protein A2U01_0053282, partial [Trifolium medium]|nr:hypothetical protein [Trifolium medium]